MPPCHHPTTTLMLNSVQWCSMLLAPLWDLWVVWNMWNMWNMWFQHVEHSTIGSDDVRPSSQVLNTRKNPQTKSNSPAGMENLTADHLVEESPTRVNYHQLVHRYGLNMWEAPSQRFLISILSRASIPALHPWILPRMVSKHFDFKNLNWTHSPSVVESPIL